MLSDAGSKELRFGETSFQLRLAIVDHCASTYIPLEIITLTDINYEAILMSDPSTMQIFLD